MKYKHSFYNINLKEEGYNVESDNLYYNVISGKFAEIPTDINLDNPPKELIDNWFVVTTDKDEPSEYVSYQKYTITNDYPSFVALVITTTMKCNYNCEYCFEQHKGLDMTPEMLQNMKEYIKNEIDRNTNLKKFQLCFFGGEPLLRLDIIKEISEFVIPICEERNIEYIPNIVSNGYFLTKDVSNQLKDYKITSVQIAIDGFKNTYTAIRHTTNDAYDRVLKNIEESILPINIRLNVTRNNTDEIIALAKEFVQLPSVKDGKNKISLERVKDYSIPLQSGFTDDEWLAFRDRLSKEIDNKEILNKWFRNPTVCYKPCAKVSARTVILCTDGYLYKCENDIGIVSKAIGTIREGINPDNEVNKQYVCSTVNEECKKCKLLPICCGGCCRYEELLYGCKPCKIIKETVRQNINNYLKNDCLATIKVVSPKRYSGSFLAIKSNI